MPNKQINTGAHTRARCSRRQFENACTHTPGTLHISCASFHSLKSISIRRNQHNNSRKKRKKKLSKTFSITNDKQKKAHTDTITIFSKVCDLLNGKFGRFHVRQTLILFKRYVSSLSFFDLLLSNELFSLFFCYQLKKLVGEIDTC